MAGLLCAALAGGMWAVASTVRNRSTVLAEATSIAKSEPVREEFAWQIADAIVPHSAASDPIEINRANDIARKAVESDAFQQAFVAALPGDLRPSRRGRARRRRARSRASCRRAITSAGGTPPPGFTLQRRRVRPSRPAPTARPDAARRASRSAPLGILLIGIGVGDRARTAAAR